VHGFLAAGVSGDDARGGGSFMRGGRVGGGSVGGQTDSNSGRSVHRTFGQPQNPIHGFPVDIAMRGGADGEGGVSPLPCLPIIGHICKPHPARPPASSPAPGGRGQCVAISPLPTGRGFSIASTVLPAAVLQRLNSRYHINFIAPKTFTGPASSTKQTAPSRDSHKKKKFRGSPRGHPSGRT
jgi:hypothetical protein